MNKKTWNSHGMSRTREYKSWDCMWQRTTNPNYDKYQYYGGKGVKVCDRWKDFRNFHEDMGSRPEKTSLDRIDSNGNYEPGNCRWATQSEQNFNRPPRRDNKSGYAGVNQNKKTGKWHVTYGQKYIGVFTDKSDAIAARLAMEDK